MTHASHVMELMTFMRLTERVKMELRHGWLSDGRRESVAEHSWHMALLVMLTHQHLEEPVHPERCLKMALVHDLVEARAGDVPFFERSERQSTKAEREEQAIEYIRDALPGQVGQEAQPRSTETASMSMVIGVMAWLVMPLWSWSWTRRRV